MSLLLPQRRHRNSKRGDEQRRFPGHCAWVRGHRCSVPGCTATDIECAHVRDGTDGAMGVKPSDWWTVSLCSAHHAEQHRIGEAKFEQRYRIDLKAVASAFARSSPHRSRWQGRTNGAFDASR
jgi:hypothetical protein